MTRDEYEVAWDELLCAKPSRAIDVCEYRQWLEDYHDFMCAAESDEELRTYFPAPEWQRHIIETKDAAAIRLIAHCLKNDDALQFEKNERTISVASR